MDLADEAVWHRGCLCLPLRPHHGRRHAAQAATRSRRLGRASGAVPHSLTTIEMKPSSNSTPDQGPVGIVISRGKQLETAPTVFAYVWGPAPELPEETASRQVA